MKELIEIQKSLSVPKNRRGGQGNYQYRSIDDILEAVKQIMPAGCYITMTDSVENIGGRNYICATAEFHSGDDSVSCQGVAWEPEKLAAMSMPQITGSCSSYARKSALCGLFAIDDNKDVDSLTQLETGGSTGSVKQATQEQINTLMDVADAMDDTGDPSGADRLKKEIKAGMTHARAAMLVRQLA